MNIPTSATSSHHTTRSATGSRTASQGQGQEHGARRVKTELSTYGASDDGLEEMDGDDGDDAGIDPVAESKLELRRERNRIKQRNLRSESLSPAHFICAPSTIGDLRVVTYPVTFNTPSLHLHYTFTGYLFHPLGLHRCISNNIQCRADSSVERRVDYTQSLEDSIKALRSEISQSRQSITTLSANDGNYKQWIQDLEVALFREGQASEVEGLRRVWGRNIQSLPIKSKSGPGGGGNKKGKGRMPPSASGSMDRVQIPHHSASRYGMGVSTHTGSLDPLDPLSTLVQAAIVSDQSLVQPGSYSVHVPLPQGLGQNHSHPHHLGIAESSTMFHPPLPTMSPMYAFPPTQHTDHPPTPRSQSQSQSQSQAQASLIQRDRDRTSVPGPGSVVTPTTRPHPGSVSHNPSRRPSTSYNPSSSWEFQTQGQNQLQPQGQGQSQGSMDLQPHLKRKRSVSGPIINYSQSHRDPFHSLKSLSEPATARHSFQFQPPSDSSSAITLPPILSLNTTPLEHEQVRQDRHDRQDQQQQQQQQQPQQKPHQQQRQSSGLSSMPIGVGSRVSELGITLPPLRVPTSAPNTPPLPVNLPSMESKESRETSPSGVSMAKSMSIDNLLTPKASRSDELRE